MELTQDRNRWAILVLLFVARAGLGFQFQTMGSVADPVAQSLHLSFAEIGTLIGLFMIPGLALSLPPVSLAGMRRIACLSRAVCYCSRWAVSVRRSPTASA